MLTSYTCTHNCLNRDPDTDRATLQNATWIDLLSPTTEEESLVESLLEVDIPTREEMHEVETSSQLYRDGDATFVTLRVLSTLNDQQPRLTAITTVVLPQYFITVRYADPASFKNFTLQALKPGSHIASASAALLLLIETIIDRAADVLEEIGDNLDPISTEIFSQNAASMETIAAADLGGVLKSIGRSGDLASRVRESLHSVNRAIPFIELMKLDEDLQQRLKTAQKDTQSLLDHDSFLSGQIQFLLDSNLGLISIQQNAIMKTLSVAAVIFLPATLIGSIYGMNFEHMPELHWRLGFPYAISLMIVSAVAPLLYFRSKKWL